MLLHNHKRNLLHPTHRHARTTRHKFQQPALHILVISIYNAPEVADGPVGGGVAVVLRVVLKFADGDCGVALEEVLKVGGGEGTEGAGVDNGEEALREGGMLAVDGAVKEPGEVVLDEGVAVGVGDEGGFGRWRVVLVG